MTPSGAAAGTRISPASGAAGTVVLTPDSRQPGPSPGAGSARAEGAAGSSPSSSDSAAVRISSPRPAGAAQRRCCSGVPNRAIAPAPSTIEAR